MLLASRSTPHRPFFPPTEDSLWPSTKPRYLTFRSSKSRLVRWSCIEYVDERGVWGGLYEELDELFNEPKRSTS
jgi:hypothetical protein